MADLGQIINDQSIAQSSTPLNIPQVTAADLQPPVSVQNINQQLDGMTSISALQYPADIPKYYMTFNVSDYTRQSLMTVGSLTPMGHVILPLPEQLVDTNHVEYGEAALGAFGQAINQIEAGGKPVTKNVISSMRRIQSTSLTGFMSGTANAISQNVPSFSGGLKAFASGVAKELAESVPGVTEIAGVLGFSPNEFFTILLKGPVYKRHHFTWRFSPRNEWESKSLRLIIQNFNNWKAPGLAVGGALFTFPKIFQIGFEPNSSYMYKFKPAVLEDFTIDYAGSGMPTFFRPDSTNTNAPESIAFSMSFLELEFWITGDFKNVSDDGQTPNNNTTDVDGPNRTT